MTTRTRWVEITPELAEALRQYLDRQDRRENPAGTFDKAGRWYPSAGERQVCCDAVRSPSRAHPFSWLVHCRSVGHVARLHGVDESELRRAARQARPASRLGGIYYKAVAVVDGRYYSIFDGVTEYLLCQPLSQAVRREHGGGYYVYARAADAARANMPAEAKLSNAPRVVLAVEASGQHTRYACQCGACRDADAYHEGREHPDKFAFSTIRPLAVVEV